jgi:hypothetical protein
MAMSEKITAKQIGELVAQSEAGRITREMFQKFLENPNCVFGANLLQSMLASCKFGWVNDNITPENFLITEEPEDGTEYVLVHLSKVTSTDEAEAEIKKLGLELATMADFLLYVRKNPDKQREFPIVALGVRWQFPSGSWYSPCASDWLGKRLLGLLYRGSDWHGNYRFLARKPR